MIQGCHRVPLLFLLVAKSLSLHILRVKNSGVFMGMHIGQRLWITHIFFIDDNLICSDKTRRYLGKLLDIINLLCNAI